MVTSTHLLTFVLIFYLFGRFLCLEVSIKENHNIRVDPFKTRINKRDITQFFDKATYSFNGFEKIESVPIIFPQDICIFMVKNVRHYACLHVNKESVQNFAVFKAENATYELLLNITTPLAVSMDCSSFGQKGFVALAYNITNPIEQANLGSPIFQVDSERIKAIQYFGTMNLRHVYFRVTPNDLFLLQTFYSSTASSNLFCPHFKWAGYGFTKLGKIPCSNAHRVEPFVIDSENYVAVANYADQYGQMATNSEIYKFDRQKKQLVLFQKIKTFGAVDVKYFSVPFEQVKKQHFLIIGNTRSTSKNQADQMEADSVIYKFEKGSFIPYQMLSLYSVQKFLPVENVELEKFILLVACSNQDIKVFNLNDWKFEESKAQFTEGALSKGVSNMRIFKDNENSYLVIANERMLENETNVFLPIYTQEEHANTLRQNVIDWTVAAIDRLSKIDVEKLKSDVVSTANLKKDRSKTLDITDVPSAEIEIAYTRSLNHFNRNLTISYWTALSYAHQAIETLERRVSRKFSIKRHTANDESPEYIHETLNVGTLVVRKQLKAMKINGIDLSNIQLKTFSAPKIIVNGVFQRPIETKSRSDITPEFLDILSVDHIKITGKLNDLSWNDIQSNTLKKTGQQFLKTTVNISSLITDRMVTSSGVINDQNISKLVQIDHGSYVINQDIQFSKPIYAEKLTINDRLNNIHVLQDKLDVLLLNSDDTQHITGRKTFENVKLLEPVTISGKIFGDLDIMSPFKPIHRSINLTGDFTITGEVSVEELLIVSNMFGASGTYGLKRVIDEGLSAFGPFQRLKLNFKQPIEANSSIIKFANEFDLQELVRIDTEEVQIIGGHKTIKGDLQISKGFAEVKIVNNIDVDQLERSVLKNDGTQNVTGNLRFKKIKAKRISSPSLLFRGNNFANLVTKSTDQVSSGSLTISKLNAQHASFTNVQTDKNVFDNQLASVTHIESANPSPDIFKNYKGTIHAQNLKVLGFINENSVENIERLLTQLNGNIKYVGGMSFQSPMQVSNLTFTGKFNGIAAQNFGNSWLQQNNEQVFKAPQIFDSARILRGIELTGQLNQYNITEYTNGVYKINQDEHISDVVFESSIKINSTLHTSTVNGLHIPEDILFLDSTDPQVLNNAITCHKNVHVNGLIRKFSNINGIHLIQLNDYLDSDFDTITVEDAIFDISPSFVTLNSHNLKETMDSVWFANADVDLQHHVEIADGYFEGPLGFYGPINGMNLKYLEENYFSLSKPQQVSAEITFTKHVVFESDFDVQNLQLYGTIIDKTSNLEINFNNITQNSLLNSGKEQRVTGQWKIFEGTITGDLNNVQINNLNLSDDVLRLDIPQNQITAPKRFQSAAITNLYCEPSSTVNGVEPTEWIQRSVFVYENYTIEGKTILDSVIFINDVKALGSVNNFNFDEQYLFLRDREQVIQGNVKIVTKLTEQQRMLSNTFAELNAVSVNGLNIDEFFGYQASGHVQLEIKSFLTFVNPVYTDHFDSGIELIQTNDSIGDFNLIKDKSLSATEELTNILQKIGQVHNGDKYYLSHFEHKQTMHVSGKNVISLTLRVGEEFVDIIGVLRESDDSNVLFYRWDFYQQQFIMDKQLTWLPRKKRLIDIFRVAFGKTEYLAIETSLDDEFYHNVISTETKELEEIFKNNTSSMIEALQLDGEHCFVVYKDVEGILRVYCVQIGENRLQFVQKNDLRRDGVLQIVSLEYDYIAILLGDCIEIWKPNEPKKFKQKILAVNPSQIASVVGKDSIKYIAICSKSKPKSFHHGSVDIYRALNYAHFEHMQTIDVVSPLQVEFALLPESQDILLNILTESFDEPLAIYQYKGVIGFQPIVGSSTIPPGTSLSVIHLKASHQHLLAVISTDDITLIETVISKT